MVSNISVTVTHHGGCHSYCSTGTCINHTQVLAEPLKLQLFRVQTPKQPYQLQLEYDWGGQCAKLTTHERAGGLQLSGEILIESKHRHTQSRPIKVTGT